MSKMREREFFSLVLVFKIATLEFKHHYANPSSGFSLKVRWDLAVNSCSKIPADKVSLCLVEALKTFESCFISKRLIDEEDFNAFISFASKGEAKCDCLFFENFGENEEISIRNTSCVFVMYGFKFTYTNKGFLPTLEIEWYKPDG